MNSIFEYFSLWFCLKKFFAWMLRFCVKLQNAVEQRGTGCVILTKNTKIDPITLDELDSAEREIIRHVQNESFEEEVATLKRSGPSVLIGEGVRKRQIKKTSKVIKLDPRLLDGVLCIRGRLGNGPFQQESKHPMILPKSHHVVTLIIRHYHQVSRHSGAEYVLSLMREILDHWCQGCSTEVSPCLCRLQEKTGPGWRAEDGKSAKQSHQTGPRSPMWVLTASSPS